MTTLERRHDQKGISRQLGLALSNNAGRMQVRRQPWQVAIYQHRQARVV
jgi:hypothetical protein